VFHVSSLHAEFPALQLDTIYLQKFQAIKKGPHQLFESKSFKCIEVRKDHREAKLAALFMILSRHEVKPYVKTIRNVCASKLAQIHELSTLAYENFILFYTESMFL
jgi:N-dimethylarginine dimethylaminohydrolase